MRVCGQTIGGGAARDHETSEGREPTPAGQGVWGKPRNHSTNGPVSCGWVSYVRSMLSVLVDLAPRCRLRLGSSACHPSRVDHLDPTTGIDARAPKRQATTDVAFGGLPQPQSRRRNATASTARYLVREEVLRWVHVTLVLVLQLRQRPEVRQVVHLSLVDTTLPKYRPQEDVVDLRAVAGVLDAGASQALDDVQSQRDVAGQEVQSEALVFLPVLAPVDGALKREGVVPLCGSWRQFLPDCKRRASSRPLAGIEVGHLTPTPPVLCP